MLAHVNRRRALDWFVPAAAGAVSAAVLSVGFFLGVSGRFGEPLGPRPASASAAEVTPWSRGGTYNLVALGDSISAGTGDAAGGGRGYAGRVAETLRRRGLTVAFTNLAAPGDQTRDLLRRLGGEELRRQVAGANLILLSMGGNDLTRAMRDPTADDEADAPEAALATAAANLREIVARLRAANPTAAIRLVGLYNPFEVEPADEPKVRAQLLDWNLAIERATLDHQGVLAVAVADLFVGRPDRLAGDRFHPGPRGHDAIAQRVLATLREAER